jgi:conjugative relaxase-like TrwC/TraI family protein
VVVVLSIGKLANPEYVLKGIAQSPEEYYLGHGEATGVWLGSGRSEFGLDGEVDADALRSIIAGEDPATGTRLAAKNRRIAGYDLCLRAPKSVSLLFGLGDPELSRVVRDCHDEAVEAGLDFMERSAGWTRRGKDGVRPERNERFISAAFRHRTSREGDPHLHTHVVTANMVHNSTGGWTTLDGRVLYRQSKAGGCMYEAELRRLLTLRLGIEWGPVSDGIADVAAMPPEVLRHFSKRRAQIQAQLDELGYSSPKAAEIAALDTRKPKDLGASAVGLRDRWVDEARSIGYEPDRFQDLFDRGAPTILTAADIEAVHRKLESSHGLTAEASTFSRCSVIIEWTNHLPQGLPPAEVEALADEFLARAEVVSVSGPSDTGDLAMAGVAKAGIYSTRELVALEQRMMDDAVSRIHDIVGVVHESHLAGALSARPTISTEQARLVATLTTSGAGVDIVNAPAGTGKTFCLDAARDAWEAAGLTVIGCALAARAAAQLESSAGIPSSTIARLLIDLDTHREHGGLPESAVIVIDEAAMVDSRTMVRLLDHAHAARAKVVLVGDHKQLEEIGPGGAFRGFTDRLDTLYLTENHRQREAWEKAALKELRDGDLDVALAAYQEHGRVVTAATASDVRQQIVADWWAATVAGEQAVMIAARWVDVEALNTIARARMTIDERLTGPEVTTADGERTFQAGDRVLALRNDKRRGLTNGSVGTVTAVDADNRTVSVQLDTGARCEVPPKYLDAGHLAHGYATTAHKAQGLTCDRALLLGNDALYRELGYVGLSRGRLGNHLYVVGRDREETPEHTSPHLEPDALEVVTDALRRSRGQQLAIDFAGNTAGRGEPDLGDLLRERRSLRVLLAAAPPDPSTELAALKRQRSDTAALLVRSEEQLAVLGPRGLRERLGRANADRVVLETTVERHRSGLARLDDAIDRLEDQADDHLLFTDRHRAQIDRLAEVDKRADALLARHLGRIGRNPPPHLVRTLGSIPADRVRSTAWWQSAEAVETYRLEVGYEGDDLLGPEPADARLAERHSITAMTVRMNDLVLRDAPARSRGLSLA